MHGGIGRAPLASVYSRDLFEHQAANSLSGVGASIIGSINLTNFDLIAGGTIDATAGASARSRSCLCTRPAKSTS